MITAILWALIICLFGTNADSPNNHRFTRPKNRASNEDTVVPLSIQVCRAGIPRQETTSFTSAQDQADRFA
jgi:hypothetical protein